MATLIAKADGNFTTASTWGVVDTTSLNTTISTGTTLTTSNQLSSTFNPGAITVEGLAVYVGTRLGSTGTMTVGLFVSGTLVTGTDVTINVSDLPNISTFVTGGGIGWVFFKFASPVTLASGNHTLGARTSSASQVTLRSTSGTNWARALRTATTGAPATSDVLIITGEWTGAGAVTSRTVTMNSTATTIYGQIDISTNGILTYGTSAATNYYLRTSGDIYVKPNGVFRIGTSGTPIPSGSTAVLEFSAAGVATIGLLVNSLGTFESYGASKTPWTMLTVDAAAAATSFTVTSTTGWAASDDVVFAPTARTVAQFEKLAIATVPTGTTFTTAATANAHSGTSPIAGEVGNLTRNIKIRGLTTTTTGYIQVWDTATFSASYTQFSFLGHSSTAGKRGVELWTTSGSASLSYCAFHDFASTAIGTYIGTIATSNVTLNYNTYYNLTNGIIFIAAHTGTTISMTNNCIIGGLTGATFTSYNHTFTGNRLAGCSSVGINFGASALTNSGTINTNYIHTCGVGISVIGDILYAEIGSFTIWFCTSVGVNFSTSISCDYLSFNSFNLFGSVSNILVSGATISGSIYFISATINSHASFASTNGLAITQGLEAIKNLNFVDSSFGATVGHTQDVNITSLQSSPSKISFYNSTFASSTEIANQSNLYTDSVIAYQKYQATSNSHKAVKKSSTIVNDTAIYLSSPSSMRITPISSSIKARGGSFKVAVASGKSVSVSVAVRKSTGTVYNGNQPRLILLANYTAGITTDTVIATATNAANGAFEVISGTTAAVDENCILEFVVDCDGTVGWVNIDNFIAIGVNTTTLDFYENGQASALLGAGANVILHRPRKVI